MGAESFLRRFLRSVLQVNQSQTDQVQRDILIARYNHLNDEITRYRDLVWKVVASSWAIYGSIIWYYSATDKNLFKNIQSGFIPNSFRCLLITTGIITTLSHIFCELSVLCSKRNRNLLANYLKLENFDRSHENLSDAWAITRLIISFLIFSIIIWLPIMFILWRPLIRMILRHVWPL